MKKTIHLECDWMLLVVLVVCKFESFDRVLCSINGKQYGISASISSEFASDKMALAPKRVLKKNTLMIGERKI